MRPAAFVLALCGGCVAAPPESAQSMVHRTTSPILCYMHYAGNNEDRALVASEIERRQFHCTERDVRDGGQHLRQIQAEQAQMALQRAQGRSAWTDHLMGLGLGAAAGMASSPAVGPPITCHTTTNRLTTICN